MADKKPKYIEGVGWRYETEHNQKRRHRTHRYNEVGTYLVTLVVEGRMPVFGYISGNIKARPSDSDYPFTELSPLGKAVISEELPKIHAIYPMAEVWKVCIMPDHIHLILRINSMLPEGKYLGTIVGAFKGGVSRAWGQGRLFEDNYNDRILMREGQLNNWKSYLAANPFRRLVMRTNPEVMKRSLCIVINGVRYGAFGNFLLLRHPEKVQVFFHRKMEDDRLTPATQEPQPSSSVVGSPSSVVGSSSCVVGSSSSVVGSSSSVVGSSSSVVGSSSCVVGSSLCQRRQPLKIPTEQTRFWEYEHRRLTELAEQGDVLVTPGISECEKRIKNECLHNRFRLIHLQAEPIGRYWKPELSRFEACAAGTLLILAPWQEDLQGTSDYERFHNLNDMAASICALDSTADCVVKPPTEQPLMRN